MPFKKGNTVRGSRKGIPNKFTGELHDMILNALQGAGGQKYLETQAKENPNAFLALIGKTLPLKVGAGNGSGRLVLEWRQTPE